MKKTIKWLTSLCLVGALLVAVICTAFASSTPSLLNPGDLHPIRASKKQLARKTFEDKEIGLVLGGGGLRGAYEIGAVEALKDMGLYDNVVALSGTSIGAINVACLSGSGFEAAKKAWLTLQTTDTFPLQCPATLETGLASKEGLSNMLDTAMDLSKVQTSSIPTYVCVSRQINKLLYVPEYKQLNGLSVADIKQYTMASASVPIVFSAETLHNATYYDGGITDMVPTAPLYRLGIRNFIAIGISLANIGPVLYPNTNICYIESLDPAIINDLATADMSIYNNYYRYALGYYEAAETVLAHEEGRLANLSQCSAYAHDYAKRLCGENMDSVIIPNINNAKNKVVNFFRSLWK